MKTVNKIKGNKHKIKKKPVVKPKKAQVLVVAQEIKFARLLSGNEKKTRDRVLKSLKKWLMNCFQKGYEFKEDDFIRVWKGLFYAVWMSDKPLVQEELCENIAGILDQFPPEQIRHAILMFIAGLRVLATEWYGIDYHRMDKFLMLVRRYLRGGLRCLSRCQWSLDSCKMFSSVLSASDGILAVKTPHYARNSLSMLMHFVDCFLEELAKVSKGDIPNESMVELLRPFANYMCKGEALPLCGAARRLFTALLRQSDTGLRYEHATRAWKQMGCPRGGPEALELVSDDEGDEAEDDGEQSDDDGTEKPLDPRAGRVDVELANLPVPASMIANMLRDLLTNATSKAHKRTKICLQRFEQLSKEEYPLRVDDVFGDDDEVVSWRPSVAARQLREVERGLIADTDELALRGLSRKQRKRLLAKSRSGQSIVEDVERMRCASANESTNGDWKVESTEPDTSRDTSNKENEKKKIKKRKIKSESTTQIKKQKIEKHNESDKVITVKDKISENNGKENKNILTKDNKAEKNSKNNNNIAKVKDKKRRETEIDKNNKSNEEKKDSNKLEGIKSLALKENVKTSDGDKKNEMNKNDVAVKKPTLVVNKVKNFQKQTSDKRHENIQRKMSFNTPKKVKFVLKNNSMQGPVDYYKSVRQSPSIPYDGTKKPTKTNLKPSTPSPINPFFKKKWRIKK